VAAADGTASMKAAEQLANVRVRSAWEAVDKAQKQRDGAAVRLKQIPKGSSAADKKARAAAKRFLATAERALRKSLSSARLLVKAGMTLLEDLIAVQPTIERESIYGSACKRLALIEAAAGRPREKRRAIEAMKLHYQRAAVIARESQAPDLFYPSLNYLAAELALNAGRNGWKGLDVAMVEATRKSLEAKSVAEPDFWSVVGQTELLLYNALAGGKLASSRESIEKGYQDLYRRVSAAWMWSSVYDTVNFVLQSYPARASAQEFKAAESLQECLRTFAQAK
jgi:hypothetical protein